MIERQEIPLGTGRRSLAELRLVYTAMLAHELPFWERGLWVAGVDEAGRGPLAGPVSAAAVVLDPDRPLYGVDDSKRLSPARRRALLPQIFRLARGVGVGFAEADEVDRWGIAEATRIAMRRALAALPFVPDVVLVDAFPPGSGLHEVSLVRGDRRSASIAAASVVAKELRDRRLRAYGGLYPDYGFERHVGYGTAAHREALVLHGPSAIHRRSFLRNFGWSADRPGDDREEGEVPNARL
ncbi:MAG: Ribonuclease HII [Brockia lithotrophica]|uniref:Ribonuclease HII n=1 Tax=Brockia lithotrophica TaxID=933949 RepID=A0A2T5G920_9BACL|nr:MAG: Ribonuclease HII [Brockia lithotrophica]